jgi:molecular chaperone IbpA
MTIHFPHHAFVGFDRIFNELERLQDTKLQTNNYPPHNIIDLGDNKFTIEIAVAGFTQEDLTLTLADGVLTVSGEKDDKRSYAYRGISARKFSKVFNLAEHVHVTGADLQNGILIVDLEKVVPEEMKPKTIPIGYTGKTHTNAKENRKLLKESISNIV